MNEWYADAHSDLPSSVIVERERGRDQVIAENYLEGMRRGSIGFRVMATIVDDEYLPELGLRRGLKSFVGLRREIEETDGLELVTTAEAVEAVDGSGPISVLLSLEGVEPFAGDLDMVDVFYDLGLRLVTLTHARRNALATAPSTRHAPRANPAVSRISVSICSGG